MGRLPVPSYWLVRSPGGKSSQLAEGELSGHTCSDPHISSSHPSAIMSKSSRRGSPTPTSDSPFFGHEEEEVNCPLCLEEMDGSDCRFKPCPCGYQICRFCWHRIREEGNERCPACRRIYTDEDIEFLPETPVLARPSKGRAGRRSGGESAAVASVTGTGVSAPATAASSAAVPAGVVPSRRHLVDIRVIQKNLVYVIGISARIAHEHILKETEYFGQFGRIVKIVVNRRNTGAPLPPSATASSGGTATTTSGSAYVTYGRAEEAARAIAYIDGSVFDGRILRATYGTTKYCSFFLRGVACPNAGCMYLHEEGDQAVSYTKEELSAGKLHLHSNLVDKAEEATHRQFGTIMYHPPSSRREAPASTMTTVTANSSRSSANQSPITANPSPPPAPQSQDPVVEPPQLIASPINLALYEEEAVSFLNRLSRWNPAIDFDIQGEEQPPQQSLQQQKLSAQRVGGTPSSILPSAQFTSYQHRGQEREQHAHADSDHYQFDPFAAETATTGTSLAQHRLGLNHPSQYYQAPTHLATGSNVSVVAGVGAVRSPGTTPMISRGGGALLGFDWSGARGGVRVEEPSLVRADIPRNFPTRDPSPSSLQPHPMIRPAPVGSPVGGPLRSASGELSPSSGPIIPGQHSQTQSSQQQHTYAAPAPLAPANLDEIFGFYGSQSVSGAAAMTAPTTTTVPLTSLQRQQAPRKVLDASLLERQFFHSDQGPLAGGTGGASEPGTTGLSATAEQPVKFNQVAATPASPIITGTSSGVNGTSLSSTAVGSLPAIAATPAMGVPKMTTATVVPKPTIKILKREGREGGVGNRETTHTSATAAPTTSKEFAAPTYKDAFGGSRRQMTILTKDRSAASPPSARHHLSAAMTASPGISMVSPIISKSNVFAALLEDEDEDEEDEENEPEGDHDNDKAKRMIAGHADGDENQNEDEKRPREKEKEKGQGRDGDKGRERERREEKEAVGMGGEKRDRGAGREGQKRDILTPDLTHQGDVTACEATKLTGEVSINAATTAPSMSASSGMKQATGKGDVLLAKSASGTLPAIGALATGGSKKKKQKKTVDPTEPKVIVRPTMPKLASHPDYAFVEPSWTNNFAVARPPSLELMSEEERTAWRRWLEEDLKCTRLEEQRLRFKVIKLYEESIQWISGLGLASAS